MGDVDLNSLVDNIVITQFEHWTEYRSPSGNVFLAQRERRYSRRPKFPDMSLESTRLETFKCWPIQMKQTPKELSDAGFFYTLKGDRVVCYYCGGGLHTWEAEDIPWEQHALNYGGCNYLNVLKGMDYVDQVRKNLLEKINKIKIEDDSGAVAVAELMEDNGNELAMALPSSSDAQKNTDGEKSKIEPREARLCHICCEAEYNTVFLPCGHVAACAKCALVLNRCPICQSELDDVKRIYFT